MFCTTVDFIKLKADNRLDTKDLKLLIDFVHLIKKEPVKTIHSSSRNTPQ